jgi:hypothetical protein
MQPEEGLSLSDRLGGVYSIATVIDDLIDRIMVDPRLMPIPEWTKRIIVFRLRDSSTWRLNWCARLQAVHKNTRASRWPILIGI